MGTYYVDATLSTGANDGSSETDAWQSLEEAIDQTNQPGHPTAGDTVLCRHTSSPDETLSTATVADGLSGTLVTPVAYIGVNSSWVEDGSRYELDGNATADSCLSFSGTDYTLWKHFSITGATASGVLHAGTGSDYHTFINCVAHNNGGKGFYAYRNVGGMYFACLAYGNGHEGWYTGSSCKFFFCCSRDNTEEGFNGLAGAGNIFFNCLAYDNTKQGFYISSTTVLINCVSDNNTQDALKLDVDRSVIIGCRLTNTQAGYYGLDAGDEGFYSGYNYFQSNAAGNIVNGANENYINLSASVTTNQFDQSDTDEGYTSLTEGSENYELDSDATLFETAIQIPTGQ